MFFGQDRRGEPGGWKFKRAPFLHRCSRASHKADVPAKGSRFWGASNENDLGIDGWRGRCNLPVGGRRKLSRVTSNPPIRLSSIRQIKLT